MQFLFPSSWKSIIPWQAQSVRSGDVKKTRMQYNEAADMKINTFLWPKKNTQQPGYWIQVHKYTQGAKLGNETKMDKTEGKTVETNDSKIKENYIID